MSNRRTLGLLIFDLDGTLIDSVDRNIAAYAAAASAIFGASPQDAAAQYIQTMGQPLEFQASQFASRFGPDAPKAAELIEAFWVEAAASFPEAFSDALRAVRQLRDAGYLIAVSTGLRTDLATDRLVRTGLAESISYVLGSDPAHGLKGRDHFTWLAAALTGLVGDFHRHALFVGDTQGDVELARSVDIPMVLCWRSGHPQHHANVNLQVADLDQLVAALHTGLSEWMAVDRFVALHPPPKSQNSPLHP